MFENLSERLERSFKILKGEGKITEINVAETLKDVRRALLDADVNYKVAKQFTDTVKAKAMGQDVLTAVKPGQMMVKIVHDELAALMGGETADVKNPSWHLCRHEGYFALLLSHYSFLSFRIFIPQLRARLQVVKIVSHYILMQRYIYLGFSRPKCYCNVMSPFVSARLVADGVDLRVQ